MENYFSSLSESFEELETCVQSYPNLLVEPKENLGEPKRNFLHFPHEQIIYENSFPKSSLLVNPFEKDLFSEVLHKACKLICLVSFIACLFSHMFDEI